MGHVVPSLDGVGWITDVAHKADRIMSYFLVSEYSQSVVHRGRVSSFPYILEDKAKNQTDLRQAVKTALFNLFSAYFDNAQVEVEVNEILDEKGSPTAKLDIRLLVVVTEAGVKYSLGRLCGTVNGKLQSIIDLKQIR